MESSQDRQKSFFEQSSFGILMATIALVVAGLALLPHLQTGLEPQVAGKEISIRYVWDKAAPETVESEVTSYVAGVCCTLPGIRSLSSYSRTNEGGITLEFGEDKDMNAARMEVSTLLRRARAQLPEDVTGIQVSGGSLFGESERILSYAVFSTLPEEEMRVFIQDRLERPLALIAGVNDVALTGLNESRWEVRCQEAVLRSLGLTLADVRLAILENFGEAYLGSALERSRDRDGFLRIPVYYQGTHDLDDLGSIGLQTADGHRVRLGDLASLERRSALAFSQFRINGLSTLRVSVLADKEANILQVGKEAEAVIRDLQSQLPAGVSIRKELDATESLKKELRNIYARTALSFVILLLFVSLVSRRPRYIFVVFFSLLATLAVSVLFFYLFHIQINLYSLAGITVSFGIIIDNIIVMQDHLMLRRDLRGFPALLAATLTTIGALSVIFLLEEEVKLKLGGFAAVFAVTLGVSLFTALFLVPALNQLLRVARTRRLPFWSRTRLLRWFAFLDRFWALLNRRKGWVALVLVLGFGLPVFRLPAEVGKDREEEERSRAQAFYNRTLGGDFYQDKLKKILDAGLGGSLRPFLEKKQAGSFYYYATRREAREAGISITGRMETGSSRDMTDKVCRSLENYLNSLEEISLYTTTVTGGSMRIEVELKEEFHFDYRALLTKNRIAHTCMGLGAATWRVYGTGDVFEGDMPFSNDVLGSIGMQNMRIELKGYDLAQLYDLAAWLAERMERNPRFQDISVSSRIDYYTPREYAYQLSPRTAYLRQTGVTAADVLQEVSGLSAGGTSVYLNTGKGFEEVNLSSDWTREQDVWNLMHRTRSLGDKQMAVGDVLDRSFQQANQTIRKEDGQYLLSILYNFVGPGPLHERLRDAILKEVKARQPLGYSSGPEVYSWGGWRSDDTVGGQLKLFVLIVLIIYFICAILLNSFRQPLVVIFMIPVSFIGIFLTFSLFELPFDNGIFAAFIFTSGLSVNSALYIINEYNSLRKMRPGAPPPVLYGAAFRHKIMPINYTIVSTVLGLLPFLLINRGQTFWYPFAVGTIAGCVFSLLGVFVFLPGFLGLGLGKPREALLP
ncbi:MAG: efflux RND transporter permease subunit [Bacteroidales bacterium]